MRVLDNLMEIYTLKNTHCMYKVSDPLDSLYSSRKKSNAEFHFEILFYWKLVNIKKTFNLGGHIAWCLVSLQELRRCQQQLKNTQKQIPNFCSPVQFYWIIPFCSIYFAHDCLSKHIFGPNSAQSPANSNFLAFLITPKHFCELQ